MTCPITLEVAQALKERQFSIHFLWEEEVEYWEQLVQQAREDEPSPETVRLRAFYLLEVLLQLAESLFGADRLSSYERSAAGLSALIESAARMRRTLLADEGEARLEAPLNLPLALYGIERNRALVDAIVEAAQILRPMLRGHTRAVSKLGRVLGTALARHYGFEECQRTLEILLTVSISNPLAPWNTKKNSPA